MTVKQLIEALSKCPPDAEVLTQAEYIDDLDGIGEVSMRFWPEDNDHTVYLHPLHRWGGFTCPEEASFHPLVAAEEADRNAPDENDTRLWADPAYPEDARVLEFEMHGQIDNEVPQHGDIDTDATGRRFWNWNIGSSDGTRTPEPKEGFKIIACGTDAIAAEGEWTERQARQVFCAVLNAHRHDPALARNFEGLTHRIVTAEAWEYEKEIDEEIEGWTNP